MQKVADERDDIRKTAAAIRDFTGKNPRGWLGPGLTETWETPDLLVEEGYEYVCDWVLDDQPVMLKTRTKPIVGIPYTQECNDVAMMLIQHHKASEYYDRAVDQFEQLYRDAARSARIMALVVHPYIMGAPHRLKYFRAALAHIRAYRDVLFWTGEEILDWYRAQQRIITTILNCIGNRSLLHLQQICSKPSSFGCGECPRGRQRGRSWSKLIAVAAIRIGQFR